MYRNLLRSVMDSGVPCYHGKYLWEDLKLALEASEYEYLRMHYPNVDGLTVEQLQDG